MYVCPKGPSILQQNLLTILVERRETQSESDEDTVLSYMFGRDKLRPREYRILLDSLPRHYHLKLYQRLKQYDSTETDLKSVWKLRTTIRHRRARSLANTPEFQRWIAEPCSQQLLILNKVECSEGSLGSSLLCLIAISSS